MSKHYLFLGLILSIPSLVIAMDKKVPKLSIPPRTNNNGSHPCHPHTPRYSVQSTGTPAYQSQTFNNFINELDGKDDLITLIELLKDEEYLKSYSPAIILKALGNGRIIEDSPLSSKDNWKNYQPSGIQKEKYAETMLRIIAEKGLKSNDPENKQKHIQNYLHITRIIEKN